MNVADLYATTKLVFGTMCDLGHVNHFRQIVSVKLSKLNQYWFEPNQWADVGLGVGLVTLPDRYATAKLPLGNICDFGHVDMFATSRR